MSLVDVKEWLYGCSHCGTCKDVLNIFAPACPAGERFQLASYFPSGQIFIARAVSEGILSLDDEELRDRIYACTGCLSCEQQCGVYHHQHIFEIVQALRTEAVTQGLLNPAYMVMVDSLRRGKSVDNGFYKRKDLQIIHYQHFPEDGIIAETMCDKRVPVDEEAIFIKGLCKFLR